jgi:hypothetical protein
MNRSEFLKKLGIGLGVAVIAPKVLASVPEKRLDAERIDPLSINDEEGKWRHEPIPRALRMNEFVINEKISGTQKGGAIHITTDSELWVNEYILVHHRYIAYAKKPQIFMIISHIGNDYTAYPLNAKVRIKNGGIPSGTMLFFSYSPHYAKF